MKRDVWKGKWQKHEALSHSGQSFTHKASPLGHTDPPLHVLKELKFQSDPTRRERMVNEVALLKKLNHPKLAKYVDSNADSGNLDEEFYLVMEYVPGPRLTDFVSAQLPPIAQTVRILTELLSTLEYCHSQHTLHRDIKPDNIILRDSSPDDPVLIDFGLSFNQEIRHANFNTPLDEHLGNRFIILPEYAADPNGKRDARSDIAQCVGILFYLATGYAPSSIIDAQNQKPHERAAAAEKIRTYSSHASHQLQRIFTIGFNHEFDRRWQSIPSLLRELQILSDPPPQRPPLADRISKINERLLQTPQVQISERIQHLTKALHDLFIKIGDGFNKHLQPSLSQLLPRNPQNRPHQITAFSWILTFRHNPLPPLTYGFYAVQETNNHEIVISGFLDSTPNRDLIRFGLFDDEFPRLTSNALEEFLHDFVLPRLEQ